ncbi:MAG: hypothetical protein F4Z66_09510 [Gammaproteobacteria bacterium]|nr:hypothetical protein [Gammaproteobacteria bacterium]
MILEASLYDYNITRSVGPLLSGLCSNFDDVALESIKFEVAGNVRGPRFDAIARINVLGRPMELAVEVKSNGQPRTVRDGVLFLRNAISASNMNAIPLFVAPFVSEQSREICKFNGTNYMDLAGNSYLKLPNLLVDIATGITPRPERRALKSLFGTKASRMIRAMLKEPTRPWRVKELASAAHISLGLASNVRRGLLSREWAQETHEGIVLAAPDLVLDAWNESYSPNLEEISLYTTLHGKSLESSIRRLFSDQSTCGKVMYGSFTAARWIAPYGRTSTEFLYATPSVLDFIQETLNAVRVGEGGNVVVQLTGDSSVLEDVIEPVEGIICTSPLQTYLDLCRAGERGKEAAEFLRQRVLNGVQ